MQRFRVGFRSGAQQRSGARDSWGDSEQQGRGSLLGFRSGAQVQRGAGRQLLGSVRPTAPRSQCGREVFKGSAGGAGRQLPSRRNEQRRRLFLRVSEWSAGAFLGRALAPHERCWEFLNQEIFRLFSNNVLQRKFETSRVLTEFQTTQTSSLLEPAEYEWQSSFSCSPKACLILKSSMSTLLA